MRYLTRLKEARLTHGLTLEKLGNNVGHSRQFMHFVENGKIKFSSELAVKIIVAMGITPDIMLLNEQY